MSGGNVFTDVCLSVYKGGERHPSLRSQVPVPGPGPFLGRGTPTSGPRSFPVGIPLAGRIEVLSERTGYPLVRTGIPPPPSRTGVIHTWDWDTPYLHVPVTRVRPPADQTMGIVQLCYGRYAPYVFMQEYFLLNQCNRFCSFLPLIHKVRGKVMFPVSSPGDTLGFWSQFFSRGYPWSVVPYPFLG